MEELNKNQILIIKLPKDRETYIQKMIILFMFSAIIIFVLAKGHYDTPMYKFILFFFIVIFAIVIYDKIYQLLTIDSVELNSSELKTRKNGLIINSCQIDDLAIKVSIIFNGEIERTFYKLPSKIKLFSYREKDIGKKESETLIERLALSKLCNKGLLNESTQGHAIPLTVNNTSTEGLEAEAIYNIKKEGFKQWGWIIAPIVVFLLIITLILIK